MFPPKIARLWIGGDLPRDNSYRLVLAVKAAHVSVGLEGFEDIICEPHSIDGLLESLTEEGHLHFQGEPEQLEPIIEACSKLGLGYRYWDGETRTLEIRHAEAAPLHFMAIDPDEPLAKHADIRKGIDLLNAGETHGALLVLERAAPEIPELLPLRLVRRTT